MLMLISPAKTLDMTRSASLSQATQPQCLTHTEQLLTRLRGYSPADLESLMAISPKLAELNHQRYHDMTFPFNAENAKQAIFAFRGDVYDGIQVDTLSSEQILYLQAHLLILSGLYGVLRPLDWMQAYRLEMGTALPTARGKDLYAFWGDMLQEIMLAQLATTSSPVMVNLASVEYAKAVQLNKMPPQVRVVTPVFQDEKAGKFKIISLYAKQARGMMVRYCAEQGIQDVEDLKTFARAGYAFCADCSTVDQWIFRRPS